MFIFIRTDQTGDWLRKDEAILRRIRLAWFLLVKIMDLFNWLWSRKINRVQIENLFRLKFIEEKNNVILIEPVGVGKIHISIALGYQVS